MNKQTLKGAAAGFAFNLLFTEVASTEEDSTATHITGTAGGQPVDLLLSASDKRMTLAGLLLGKECLVNGDNLEE